MLQKLLSDVFRFPAPVNGENFSATRGSSNSQAANNEDADFLIMPPTSQIEPVQQSKIPSKVSWIGNLSTFHHLSILRFSNKLLYCSVQRHEQWDPEQRSPFQTFFVRMLRSINDLNSK